MSDVGWGGRVGTGRVKMADLEEEVHVLVHRVVKDITNAFKKNPNIDEIGVIPCSEPRYNRSPVMLVETKLGVESWCVKFLLPYVHNKLLLYRQRKHWLDREALVDVTFTLLLLNPDFTTAWNVRKELHQCGVLNPERDLYLGKLALTRFPKSPETWIHRRWVLLQILQQCSAKRCYRKEQGEASLSSVSMEGNGQILCEPLARIINEELTVCSDAAGRYASNYNAWSHRIWVLQHMAKRSIKVYLDELSSMRLWVSMHVSDHSGFHFRQFLLKAIIKELCQGQESTAMNTLPQTQSLHLQASRETSVSEDGNKKTQQSGLVTMLQLFHQEMELCSDLIQSFPGHETLWCHRRHIFFLWHHWKQDHQHSHCNNTDTKSPHSQYACTDLSSGPCTGLSKSTEQSCGGDTVNGQPQVGEVMEVDGVTSPNSHDIKRLKRSFLISCSPALQSEHNFIFSILEGCCLEQRRFALAYKKWLETVIIQ